MHHNQAHGRLFLVRSRLHISVSMPDSNRAIHVTKQAPRHPLAAILPPLFIFLITLEKNTSRGTETTSLRYRSLSTKIHRCHWGCSVVNHPELLGLKLSERLATFVCLRRAHTLHVLLQLIGDISSGKINENDCLSVLILE